MKRTLIALAALMAATSIAPAGEWHSTVATVNLQAGIITLDDGTELNVDGKLAPDDFRPGDRIVLEIDDETGAVTDMIIGA